VSPPLPLGCPPTPEGAPPLVVPPLELPPLALEPPVPSLPVGGSEQASVDSHRPRPLTMSRGSALMHG